MGIVKGMLVLLFALGFPAGVFAADIEQVKIKFDEPSVGFLNRNLEIAKRESGSVSKPFAAITGISVDAINKNGGVFGGGLSGGENSFFRKNLGIRF